MRLMRESGLVSMGPNFEKSWGGISGMPAAAVAGAAGAAAGPRRNALTSSVVTRPLSVDAELPSQPAHARAGVYLAQLGRRGVHRRTGVGGSWRARRHWRRRRRAWLGFLLLDQRWRRRGGHRFSDGFERQDRAAFTHPVAYVDVNRANSATGRRRYVHAGFVRLEGDQRVVGVDHVAGLHQDLDDRHVVEVADVGHLDLGGARGLGLDHCCHASSSCLARAADSDPGRVGFVGFDAVLADRVRHH